MGENSPKPDHSQDKDPNLPEGEGTDLLRQIVAECLERYEEEGEGAVEAVCREHPEQADAVRRRIDYLRGMGLLKGVPPEQERDVPERLGVFRLIRRLGGGGMGVVYLAEQEPLGRRVALKMIRPEHLFFSGPRKRFQREAEAVARLQHPGIVPVYTMGEERGVPFLAMELVHGCTLAEIIRSLKALRPDRLSGAELAQAITR